MRISVLGCGRWGSFIAWYLEKIGHDITLFGTSDSPHYIELNKTRKNNILEFNRKIDITCDLEKAINTSSIIIISISSQNLRSFMSEIINYDISKKTFVLCMKGIEETTGNRLSQVVEEFIPNTTRLAVWIGPGHVQDFKNGIPNCMVIDSKDQHTKEFLIKEFSSELIRFYYGADMIGNEVGAAAKNIMGIAAGMLEALNYTSLKGALMARGTREIARLIKAMGGNEISAYGLCHLGDYQATLFSEYSHNLTFGKNFIIGKENTQLAEGVATTRAILKLSKKYNVEMPICQAIDEILNQGKDSKETLKKLFLRSIKQEF